LRLPVILNASTDERARPLVSDLATVVDLSHGGAGSGEKYFATLSILAPPVRRIS